MTSKTTRRLTSRTISTISCRKWLHLPFQRLSHLEGGSQGQHKWTWRARFLQMSFFIAWLRKPYGRVESELKSVDARNRFTCVSSTWKALEGRSLFSPSLVTAAELQPPSFMRTDWDCGGPGQCVCVRACVLSLLYYMEKMKETLTFPCFHCSADLS